MAELAAVMRRKTRIIDLPTSNNLSGLTAGNANPRRGPVGASSRYRGVTRHR